ncbi:MAG: hypothetical protein J0652_04335 [Desulfobulbaceae bacterium]|nr:hypothetical protein [Desulfobulbaceae bacterium]
MDTQNNLKNSGLHCRRQENYWLGECLRAVSIPKNNPTAIEQPADFSLLTEPTGKRAQVSAEQEGNGKAGLELSDISPYRKADHAGLQKKTSYGYQGHPHEFHSW